MTDTSQTPIYDPDQPIACTIDAPDIAEHIDVLERIRHELASAERTPHGVILVLPPTETNIDDLRQFAAVEKCCAFWGFELDQQPDAIRLRWDGPPDTAAFMDHLIEYLNGRLPIGTLFGAPRSTTSRQEPRGAAHNPNAEPAVTTIGRPQVAGASRFSSA